MIIVPEKPLWGGKNKVCMYVCKCYGNVPAVVIICFSVWF